jgi:NADH dehydrogenase FAD-containing subunit
VKTKLLVEVTLRTGSFVCTGDAAGSSRFERRNVDAVVAEMSHALQGSITDLIAAKTVVWAGGIAASPLGKLLSSRTNAETDKGGRIKVNPDLTIPTTRTSTL